MKKKLICIFIVIACVIALILALPTIYLYFMSDDYVPEEVKLSVGSTENGDQRVPLLIFSADVGGNACNSVSDLESKVQYLSDEHVSITISGYSVVERPDCYSLVFNTSKGSVALRGDWLKDGDQKKITITLNGQSNDYTISHRDYMVRLVPIDVLNVHPSSHQNDEFGHPLSLSDDLIPLDVGVISLSGSVKKDSDYSVALKAMANKYGYVLAQKKYPGLVSGSRSRIYVVSGKTAIPSRKDGAQFLEDIGDGDKKVSARIFRMRSNDSY